jgi:hypothetical protein
VFQLACYEVDAEGIRSLCSFFWRLYKMEKLSVELAGMLTNMAYFLPRARTAELLLETEVVRTKLTKEGTGILSDSDPLTRLHNEWVELIAEKDYASANLRFGLGIDAVTHIWRQCVATDSTDQKMLAESSPLVLSDTYEDESDVHTERVSQQRQEIAAFVVRELLRVGPLVPMEEASLQGCLDELTRSTTKMFGQRAIDHWQPIGLEILVDAIGTIGSDISRPGLYIKRTTSSRYAD